MPKRSAEEKLHYYNSKITKLQKKCNKERRRAIIYSTSDSESDSGENILIPTDDVIHEEICDPAMEPVTETIPILSQEESQPVEPKSSDKLPELDPELLSALGETETEAPIYGEEIHPDLAQRWLPILRKGLSKEVKDKLLKDYIVPSYCKQLRAPSLNPEITAAISDMARARDKKIEAGQQQLALGITAVSKAMDLLLANDEKQAKIKVVKILSDACRILTDLHQNETQCRIKALTPGLDKSFLGVIQDVESDEFLFGAKLAEKIKASKAIEKQGLQIKKAAFVHKNSTVSASQYQPSTSQYQPMTRSRFQGNWTCPPRFQQSSRGGRGASPRIHTPVRRATTSHSQPRSPIYRPRAPTRQ